MADASLHRIGNTELFYFGPSNRRLFGAFHPASAGGSRSVLLCPPFGQEAIRLHRLFRVLANRLSRQGISTLRFDYFGTGDAEGDDGDAELDGWSRDVTAAHLELTARSTGARATWVGAGIGATLAVRASAVAAPPPQRLVLWDPVLDGQGYLELLRVKHVETLEASFSIPDPRWRRALQDDKAAFTGEAMGFALPARLRDGIARITPQSLGREVTCDVDVIADRSQDDALSWSNQLPASRRTKFHSLAADFEWMAEELRGAALVPSAALKTLLAVVQEQ
jgi:hypothetical protein